jgi:hypothetical protein
MAAFAKSWRRVVRAIFSMYWLRDLQQALSYNVGLGLGCNGLPFECPVWADETTCRQAYAEGRKAYLELVEKPTQSADAIDGNRHPAHSLSAPTPPR